MKKLIAIWCAAALMLPALSAVESGGRFDTAELEKQAVGVFTPARQSPEHADYEAVLFFDALSPDAEACLRLLDALPDTFADSGKSLRVSAVARNQQAAVTGAFPRFRPEYLAVFAENDKLEVFREYAAGETLIPFAAVISDGKLRWKGAPNDLESVLTRMIAGKFGFSTQLRIETLRRDLQSAVQSGLPEVILRSADAILAVDPADLIAVQAKLYVFEGRRQTGQGTLFLQKRCQISPDNVTLRLMLLQSLQMDGDRAMFGRELLLALKTFSAKPSVQARILAFALENAPFGWIPPDGTAAAVAAVEALVPPEKKIGRREAYYCQIAARFAFLRMNIDRAIAWETRAAEYTAGNVRSLLEYYRAVKAAAGK